MQRNYPHWFTERMMLCISSSASCLPLQFPQAENLPPSSFSAVLQKGTHAFHSTSRAEDVWWYFGATSDRHPFPSAPMQRASLYCKDLIAPLQTTVCSTAKSCLLHCKFTIHS